MKKAEFIEEMKSDLAFFRGAEERARERAEKHWEKYVRANDKDERETELCNYRTERVEQSIYRAKALLVEQYLEMYK